MNEDKFDIGDLEEVSTVPVERPFLDEIFDGCYLSVWRSGRKAGQTFTEPSMVEPVHNLSIEEILRDYSRGITHTFREGRYDEGDEVEPVAEMEDFVDLLPTSSPLPDPSETETEPKAQDYKEPSDPKEQEDPQEES